MQTLLLIGGITFFFIGVALCVAALIASAVTKKSSAAQAATIPPQAPAHIHPAAAPPTPAPPPTPAMMTAPPPPPMPPPPGSTDATMVVPIPRGNDLGALHGLSGPVAGQTFTIPPEGFHIGRDASLSQVVVANDRVSKRHVWVGVREGTVVAVDSGSTNGTFLNGFGARITQSALNPGDTLILSDDVARLEYRR